MKTFQTRRSCTDSSRRRTIQVFLDANVFIYAAGTPHPQKEPSIRVLTTAASYPGSFVTSAEVFQEILHRALAIRRWPQTKPHFRNFLLLMQYRVHEVLPADVEEAADMADVYPNVTARDLLHAAVMKRVGTHQIVSADRGFDGIDGIERLDPLRIDEWAPQVTAN